MPDDLPVEQRARWNRLLKMSPEQAGEIIAKGIERRAPRIMVGNDAKFVALVERIVPVSYWRLMEPAF